MIYPLCTKSPRERGRKPFFIESTVNNKSVLAGSSQYQRETKGKGKKRGSSSQRKRRTGTRKPNIEKRKTGRSSESEAARIHRGGKGKNEDPKQGTSP